MPRVSKLPTALPTKCGDNLADTGKETSKPNWQIRPLQELGFPVDAWKFQSDRAHSHVTEVKSSHAVHITSPDVMIDVIEQAVRATTK